MNRHMTAGLLAVVAAGPLASQGTTDTGFHEFLAAQRMEHRSGGRN